jgi:succinoglycan biosynthesis protein ExoL
LINQNVLVLLPVVGQPRHSKRIDMLIEQGFKVNVYAFEREWPKGRIPSVSYNSLGIINKKKYLERLPKLINALKILYKIRDKFDIVYCFSHDLFYITVLSSLLRKKIIILEVGDIQDHQMNKTPLGFLSRTIDRIFIKKLSLLILISDGFIPFYKRLGYSGPIQIIENKIEKSSAKNTNVNYPKNTLVNINNFKKIRIGLFGALNDEWSLQVLLGLQKRFPEKFEILIAGNGICTEKFNLSTNINNEKGISYFGEYKSPDDLETIYSQVDIIWACYFPFKKYDISYASGRPNRFFESCFFKKPIISRCGVSFSIDVEKYSIGMCINTISFDDTINLVSKISINDIYEWTQNMRLVPEDVYLLNEESTLLAKKILSLAI